MFIKLLQITWNILISLQNFSFLFKNCFLFFYNEIKFIFLGDCKLKNLWKLNGYEITDLLNKKEVSATEICNDLIEHIEKINPKINAIVIETFDDAKKQAKFLDKKIQEGKNTGLLAGVPTTVKVNTDQIGYPSTNGLRIQKDLIAKKR